MKLENGLFNKIEFEADGMPGVYYYNKKTDEIYIGDAVIETPKGKFSTVVLLSKAFVDKVDPVLVKSVLAGHVLSRYKRVKND